MSIEIVGDDFLHKFHELIRLHPNHLQTHIALFCYWDRCAHCMLFKPKWEALASQEAPRSSFAWAQANAATCFQLFRSLGITAVPRVFLARVTDPGWKNAILVPWSEEPEVVAQMVKNMVQQDQMKWKEEKEKERTQELQDKLNARRKRRERNRRRKRFSDREGHDNRAATVWNLLLRHHPSLGRWMQFSPFWSFPDSLLALRLKNMGRGSTDALRGDISYWSRAPPASPSRSVRKGLGPTLAAAMKTVAKSWMRRLIVNRQTSKRRSMTEWIYYQVQGLLQS